MKEGETARIDKFIVKESGKKNPKVLFLPTASKDLPAYSTAFKYAYEGLGCKVKILRLFDRPRLNEETFKKTILSADIIYVGGGNFDVLIAEWKKHKLVPILRQAYKQGIILCGLSAGGVVWYEYFIDNDNSKTRLKRGIGLLRGVMIPHYKSFGIFPEKAYKTGLPITAIQDRCAVMYVNEKFKGAISVDQSRAFTTRPPYVKKIPVVLFLHKSQ